MGSDSTFSKCVFKIFKPSIFLQLSRFLAVIRHLKLKCLTHKMINFKFEPF